MKVVLVEENRIPGDWLGAAEATEVDWRGFPGQSPHRALRQERMSVTLKRMLPGVYGSKDGIHGVASFQGLIIPGDISQDLNKWQLVNTFSDVTAINITIDKRSRRTN